MFQTVCLRWLTAGLTESAWDAAVACTMPGGNMPGAAIPCDIQQVLGRTQPHVPLNLHPRPGWLGACGAVPICGSSGCGWCLTEVGGEFSAVLDLRLGEAGAVHPGVHDLDRPLHLGRCRGAATGLDRLQRHGGAAGEV